MKKPGKLLRLVHNPTAGGNVCSKEKLITLIESQGYRCTYSSAKKKMLKAIEADTAFIVIAGGDGTIRKTVLSLLNKKLKHKRPIALLPFGTANNVAMSLNIPENISRNVLSWRTLNHKKFDVGQVTGLGKTFYFIESFGFGIFPRLMKALNKLTGDHIAAAEDKFELPLKTLLKITQNYKPVSFKIEIDDQRIQGTAIMIEVMNISYLGPRLNLSKDADPDDGYFDVVIVTEKDRKDMEAYIAHKLELKDPVLSIKPIRARSLQICWEGDDIHGDDQLIKSAGHTSLKLSVLGSMLEILAP